MNPSGLLFGLAMATAIGGAAGAVLTPRLVPAALALAVSALGVAGLCLALGADYIAIVVATLLGALVPAALVVAAVLAPAQQPDIRLARARRYAVAGAVAAVWALLALTLVRHPWLPAGGQRETGLAWTGSRLLSEDLTLALGGAALLALAATAAVALLRPRGRAR